MKNTRYFFVSISALAVLLFFFFSLSAEEYKLSYNTDKSFKVVQFTDCHFYIGGEKSPEVLENIKAVMDAEKPDLVVLTGEYCL